MKKIKAIVFDYDGVVELRDKSLINSIVELLGVTLKEFGDVYRLHNHRTNIDNLPWIEAIILVAKDLGADEVQITKIKELSEENNKTIKLNTELLNYVKNYIKPAGYATAILSNNTSDLRDRIRNHEIDDLFDVIVISGEEGYQKPDVEIFHSLFNKLKLNPEEIVFTDDNKRPLETADILGYTPILFRNFDQFKTDLEALIM